MCWWPILLPLLQQPPPHNEPYPPGTYVMDEDPPIHKPYSGTVKDILLESSHPPEKQLYLIQFDDSTTISVVVSDIPSLLPKPLIKLADADAD